MSAFVKGRYAADPDLGPKRANSGHTPVARCVGSAVTFLDYQTEVAGIRCTLVDENVNDAATIDALDVLGKHEAHYESVGLGKEFAGSLVR